MFPSTELKCVLVHDDTNSILMSKYENVNEFAIKHQKLIDDFTKKLTPEKIVVCEILPFLNNEWANLRLKCMMTS